MVKDPLCLVCRKANVVGFYDQLRLAPLGTIRAAEGPCPQCRRRAARELERRRPPSRHSLRAVLSGLFRH